MESSYTPHTCDHLCAGTTHDGSRNADVEVATKKEQESWPEEESRQYREYPAKMRDGLNERTMLPTTCPKSFGPVKFCPLSRGSGIIHAWTVTEDGVRRASVTDVATFT